MFGVLDVYVVREVCGSSRHVPRVGDAIVLIMRAENRIWQSNRPNVDAVRFLDVDHTKLESIPGALPQ